jgi:hypothetical protein
MGDPIWFLLTGSVSILIAWLIRKIEPIILQLFLAAIVPAILSVAAVCILNWLSPSTPGEGALGWSIILAGTWIMWAVPTCLTAVVFFQWWRRKKSEVTELHEK